MPIAPPPPTTFRQLRDANDDVADRLGSLWRLATTDDQRWEIERLADALVGADLPPHETWEDLADDIKQADPDDEVLTPHDWEDLADDIKQAVDDAIRDWRKS